MELFDLHCDTLYKAVTQNKPLNHKDFSLDIDYSKCFDKWKQFFAIWLPDSIDDDYYAYMAVNNKLEFFIRSANYFIKEKERLNLSNAYLTVENASFLEGDIDNLHYLKDYNVKALTLTWNGINELGDGAHCQNGAGLTSFGREVIRYLGDNNIAIDLSHSSDKMFWDVVNYTDKTVIATHSNCRSICKNMRNLTDEQLLLIKSRNGIVGLNLYREFLCNNNANVYDVLRHTEHMLSLGMEDNICIGTDFDGCNLTYDIKGSRDLDKLFTLFLQENYNERLVNKIFYDNANKFCENFDK